VTVLLYFYLTHHTCIFLFKYVAVIHKFTSMFKRSNDYDFFSRPYEICVFPSCFIWMLKISVTIQQLKLRTMGMEWMNSASHHSHTTFIRNFPNFSVI